MAEKVYWGWDAIEEAHAELAADIIESGNKYGSIIALSRGGLIPGVMMSHTLGIPLNPLAWSHIDSKKTDTHHLAHIMNWTPWDEKVLIVDDICDSGETLLSLHNHLNKFFYDRAGFHTATLVHNYGQELFEPNFYGKAIDKSILDAWLVFPWESES